MRILDLSGLSLYLELDWHATILHLLGLDHTQLTYRYAGRDFRLTDVQGDILKDIMA